jgi:hypothetical protein
VKIHFQTNKNKPSSTQQNGSYLNCEPSFSESVIFQTASPYVSKPTLPGRDNDIGNKNGGFCSISTGYLSYFFRRPKHHCSSIFNRMVDFAIISLPCMIVTAQDANPASPRFGQNKSRSTSFVLRLSMLT